MFRNLNSNKKLIKMKSISYFIIIGSLFLLAGCVSKKATLKTFVDPSIETSAVNSIAVFSLRNTSINPGESIEFDRALTQAILKKNKNVKIIGASEVTRKLNDAELVQEYSQFLDDFANSGIPNTKTLQKIGKVLRVDAILQGTFSQIIQKDCAPYIPNQTSLTLRYTLLNTKNGNIIWEGTSSSRKSGGRCEAWPLYDVIDLAVKKILTGLPELGK